MGWWTRHPGLGVELGDDDGMTSVADAGAATVAGPLFTAPYRTNSEASLSSVRA